MSKSNFDILAGVMNIKSPELREIALQVQANSKKLNACGYHEFVEAPGQEAKKFGKRYVCTECGGEVDCHAYYWHQDGRRAK
jgi:hypothetical protein